MIKIPLVQWQIGILLGIVLGAFLGAMAVYFIAKNHYERKKRRPTPMLESFIRRFGDAVYDDRYTKMTDREFVNLLRSTATMSLLLYQEASVRLMRKVEKDGSSQSSQKSKPS